MIMSKKRHHQILEPTSDIQIPDDSLDTVEREQEEMDSKIEKQMQDFAFLLDSLSTVEEKTKALWRQIYENAVQDRRNSYLMWIDLYKNVHGKITEHAIHGATLAKYMERMNKTNEQLIKLAELVGKASEEEIEENLSEEDMYDRINKLNSNKVQ